MKFKIEIEDLNTTAIIGTVFQMVENLAFKELEDEGSITGDLKTDYKAVNRRIQELAEDVKRNL